MPARKPLGFLAEGVRHMSGSPPAARYKQAYPDLLACILMHGWTCKHILPHSGDKEKGFHESEERVRNCSYCYQND